MLKEIYKSKNFVVYQNNVMQNNSIVITGNDIVYIFDPSFDIKEIFDKYKHFKNKIVILTHTHYDHCGDFELINSYADKIYLSINIKEWISELDPRLFFNTKPDLNKTYFVKHEEEFEDFKFYLTPGHSIDSLCVKYKNDAFIVGDHIFSNSIGRTDFQTSDPKEMNKSLLLMKEKMKNNLNAIVISGHGEIVTVKQLFNINPYL